MTLLSALAFGFMFTSIGSYGWYLAISGAQAGDTLGDKKRKCIKGYHLSDDGTQCVNIKGELGPPPGRECPDGSTWKDGCCQYPEPRGVGGYGCVGTQPSHQSTTTHTIEDAGIFYNYGKFIDDCFFFGGLYILNKDE